MALDIEIDKEEHKRKKVKEVDSLVESEMILETVPQEDINKNFEQKSANSQDSPPNPTMTSCGNINTTNMPNLDMSSPCGIIFSPANPYIKNSYTSAPNSDLQTMQYSNDTNTNQQKILKETQAEINQKDHVTSTENDTTFMEDQMEVEYNGTIRDDDLEERRPTYSSILQVNIRKS
ncbi:hypothetical protein C2G38_2047743 [Gigaspora rosea]|uniref:Uncharacterized protein n=1 Tax=Gigaspora rosea TaxID=44941 RepID=A0A397U4P9_9GLOM|nr:hypothetical protein C2G38_2047743 [Gigaspora rosea]CAG8667594.1 13696_t:CDS:1 [Gigaspora rosea]